MDLGGHCIGPDTEGAKKMNDSKQSDLFGGRKIYRGGYAGMTGAGPAGESCGSCRSLRKQYGVSGRYYKCARVRQTGGAGTDVKFRAPSCEYWQERE